MTTTEYYIQNWHNFDDNIKKLIIEKNIWTIRMPVVSTYRHNVGQYPCVITHKIKPIKYGYGRGFNKEKGKIQSIDKYALEWSTKQKQTVYVHSFENLSVDKQLELVVKELGLKPIEEIKLENL